MAQSNCVQSLKPKIGKVGRGGKSSDLKVVPPAGFSVPSQKSVLDYFHGNSVVQKMYAERVFSMMKEFIDGRIKLYPAHLNTNSDIVDFIFNNRGCKVNDTDTLAEDFLGLSIQPTPFQAKRKREKEEIAAAVVKVRALPVKKTVLPKPEAKSKKSVAVKTAKAEPVIGKFNIAGRSRKRLGFPIVSVPNFLTFFSAPRVAVFSSKGGLHDSSCQICYEVGFYTALDSAGVRRKLDLGQKAWVSILHDLVDSEGLIPAGEGARLLAVRRVMDKPEDMAVAEPVEEDLHVGEVVGHENWANSEPEEGRS